MNKGVRVAPWFSGAEQAVLLCPICDYDYQHSGRVLEFSRPDGEDSPSVVGVPGVDGWAPSDSNPSPRRQAITIDFQGECEHSWTLEIWQHKGQTLLTARVREATEERG